jgi:hypothetical protein
MTWWHQNQKQRLFLIVYRVFDWTPYNRKGNESRLAHRVYA